jgi:hypothetical protein
LCRYCQSTTSSAPRVKSDFREQRAGSLASLASIAVGMGMRLVEDMLVGLRTESTWLRLVQRGEQMELRELRARPSCSCPASSKTMGLGDAASLVGRHDWWQEVAAERVLAPRRAS